MPIEEGISQLAAMPQGGPGGGGGPMPAGPAGPSPSPAGPPPGPDPGPVAAVPQSAGSHGGPGVDTPVEQKAMELLSQGAQLIREAANVDPSIRPAIDQHLERAFLDVMSIYGMGEQAKMSLKQAKMQRDQQVSGRLNMSGPPVPPVGG